MACSINRQTVRNGIVNEITETLLASGQYLEENGVLVDVLQNKVTRLPESMERARKGKLKSATNALRGYEGLSQEDENTINLQNEQILKWAEKNNSIINRDNLGEVIAQGDESIVYRKGDTVYKVMGSTMSPSPLSHLDRIAITNTSVPNTTPVTFEGVTEVDGEVRVVVSQPYIEGTPLEEQTTVDEFMTRSGFVVQGGSTYTNDDVVIDDLRPENVLVDSAGEFHLIDVVAELNTYEDDFGGEHSYKPISNQSQIERINNEFGEKVVSVENGIVKIDVSEDLVDAYSVDLPTVDIPEIIPNEPVVITPTQKMKVSHMLDKMGVSVDNLVMNGQPANVEAVAIPLQALVGHVEGAQGALMEEAFHIALEILSVNHPGLLNKMLSQITSLPIYQQVLEEYSNLPQYQKNGKPDLLKLKKEAIAKQLASQMEQPTQVESWWGRVKNFLRELFGETGVNLAPFRETIELVTRGNIGTVRNTILQSRRYLTSQGIQPEQIDEIIELAKSDLSDEMLRFRLAQITPENVYYSVNSKTETVYTKLQNTTSTPTDSVLSRLTAFIASVVDSDTTQTFKNLVSLFGSQKDNAIHKAVFSILDRYVNSDGTIRATALPYTQTDLPLEQYEKLENMITEKLSQFPDSKILYNKTFASEMEAQMDMVVVDRKGDVHVFNFLQMDKPYVNSDEKKVIDRLAEMNKQVLRDGYNITQTGQNRTIIIPYDEGTKEISTAEDKDFGVFVSRVDKTGSAKIDSLVANLRQLSSGIRTVEEDRLFSQVASAIHALQTKGDIKALTGVLATLNSKIKDLIDSFENFSSQPRTEEEVRDFANRIARLETFTNVFTGTATAIEQAVSENPQMFTDVKDTDIGLLSYRQGALASNRERLVALNNKFIDSYLATPNGINGILVSERIVRGIQKNFNKFSDSVTKATRLLYKIVSGINRATDIEVDENRQILKKLKEDYDKIADKKNYLSHIAQKDKKGNYVHKLIEKFDKVGFREGLKKAIKDNGTNWVEENIDFKEYQKWFLEERAKRFAVYESTVYRIDEDENEKIIQEQKDRFDEVYDITKNISDKNTKIELFINEKHLSKEYQALEKNQPAFALWKYIQDINQRAYKAGALSRVDAETMIPFVEKSLVEKAMTGAKVRGSMNLLQSLMTPEDYAAETNVDPMTGVAVERIPFYFTTDISKTSKDGTQDYSNVSQDIFKILPSYLHQTVFADRMRQKESQIRLLGLVEKNKQVRLSNPFNEADSEGRTASNDANFEYYWNFVRMAVYGHRDLDGDFDTKIMTFSNKSVDWINKTLGVNISTDNKAVNVTVRNVVKTANKLFQLKVLGLNVAIPIANFVGSRLQIEINSGHDFTSKDLWRNQTKAFQNAWTSDRERDVFVGLVDYFQVLYDRGNAEQMSRQLSQSNLTKRDIPELLMSLQSESEIPIQMMIGGAMFDNTMVEDGKLVNIREFVRSKYEDYFDKSSSERVTIDQKINSEIEQLKETRALSKIASFEKGKLVIPGIERQSQTVYDFVNRLQALTKRATGGGNREDMRQINGSLLGSTLMVFKSWMPRLIQNRVSGLTYSEGLQSYEMGRYNAVGMHLSKGLSKGISNLYNVMVMNDKGVASAKQMFEEHKARYEEKTGEPLNMTQRDYVEMQQRLIKGAMKDALIFASLYGLWALIGAMQPPEDEDSAFYNAVYHMTERFQKEMSFYYNPSEWIKLGEGSLFPAIGVVKEFKNIFKETGKTIQYKLTGDESLEKKTHLYKAATKPIPILNQSGLFLQLFYEDMAKELGYKDLTPNAK